MGMHAVWEQEETERSEAAMDAARYLYHKIRSPNAKKAMQTLMQRVSSLIENPSLRDRLIRSMRSDDELVVRFRPRENVSVKRRRGPMGREGDNAKEPACLFRQSIEHLGESTLVLADVESKEHVGPFQLLKVLYCCVSQHSDPHDGLRDLFAKLQANIVSERPQVADRAAKISEAKMRELEMATPAELAQTAPYVGSAHCMAVRPLTFPCPPPLPGLRICSPYLTRTSSTFLGV